MKPGDQPTFDTHPAQTDRDWSGSLVASASALVATYREVRRVAGVGEGLDAGALVKLRRSLAEEMADISRLIGNLPGHPDVDALRKSYAALRTALAEHQAKWPAIAAREVPSAHRSSLDQADAKLQQFVEACRRFGMAVRR